MTSESDANQRVHSFVGKDPAVEEKMAAVGKHVEDVSTLGHNLVYDEDDEPEIHARTLVAIAALCLLNMTQLVALLGPPTVLSYIGNDLRNTAQQNWVASALSLVQAVMSPVIASASDTFQARKALLVGPCLLSFVGAAIAPGSSSIYRLIVAQILIGFGFATVPLAYCVPSEILPRRWRPMVQALLNVFASIGACAAPLVIGALTRNNPHTGWRNFYWIQMALWGVTAAGLFIGYRPPKRHTRLDHLTIWQKIGRLDLLGFGLLTTSLTLLLAGIYLGGGEFGWTGRQVLCPLVVGIVVLVAFGVYEWRFNKAGILHHDLFRGGKDRGRTFAICIGLIFIEGIMFFSYVVFYPAMTAALFESDPFLLAARSQPLWIAAGISTVFYGYASTKLKSIRSPMFVGFLIFTAALVGITTIQPNDSTRLLVFVGLEGIGLAGPLILLISGVQLSVPHELIATATAVTTSSRAIAGAVFTAVYSAALNTRLVKYIPSYIAKAALAAELPPKSLPAFIEALANHNTAALPGIPGITPEIIGAGVTALKQALADGFRVVFIIGAPFGVLACIGCFFLGNLRSSMNYHVDAPVEELHARHHRGEGTVERP